MILALYNTRIFFRSHLKIIPEITIHHWKTISKLTGCLVKWLKIRLPTDEEKVTLVCNVLAFLEAVFRNIFHRIQYLPFQKSRTGLKINESDKYSFLVHPLPREVESHDLPACIYRDIFFEIQELTMFIDKNDEYSPVLPSLLGLAM